MKRGMWNEAKMRDFMDKLDVSGHEAPATQPPRADVKASNR